MIEAPMDWTLLIDPAALAIVGLGSLAIAWIQNGFGAIREAIGGLRRLLTVSRDGERSRLARLIVEDIVDRRGVACADRGPQTCPFTHEASRLMSDETSYAGFSRAIGELLDRHIAQRQRTVRVWNDIADAAPALGMLGTVVGLVQMFAVMQSSQGIGLAMALCLLTSLYGLVLAHLVAGPLARRLELVSAIEAEWQEQTASRMLALARREYPDGIDHGRVLDLKKGALAGVAQAS